MGRTGFQEKIVSLRVLYISLGRPVWILAYIGFRIKHCFHECPTICRNGPDGFCTPMEETTSTGTFVCRSDIPLVPKPSKLESLLDKTIGRDFC